MRFGEWYVRRGRIPRVAWWLNYVLPIGLLGVLGGIADSALGYPEPTTDPVQGWIGEYVGGPVGVVVALVTLVPLVTAAVARLHDRGHSARRLWWLLVPVVGWLLIVVEIWFLRGEPGANRYGPPVPIGAGGSLPVGSPAG